MTTHLDNTNEDGYGWAGRAVSYLIISIVAAFALFLLYGCQAQPTAVPQLNINRSTGDIEKARAEYKAAHDVLAQLTKSAGNNLSFGFGLIEGFLTEGDTTMKDVSADSIKANDDWTKAYNEQGTKLNVVSAQLTTANEDLDNFFSRKQRRLAIWLTIGAATIFGAYEFISYYTAGAPVLKFIVGFFSKLFGKK